MAGVLKKRLLEYPQRERCAPGYDRPQDAPNPGRPLRSCWDI